MKKILKTLMCVAFAFLLVCQFAGNVDAFAAGDFTVSVIAPDASAGDPNTIKCGDGDFLSNSTVAKVKQYGIVIYPAEGIEFLEHFSIAGVDMSNYLTATSNNIVKVEADALKDFNFGTAPISVYVSYAKINENLNVPVFYDDGDATLSSVLSAGASSTKANQNFIVPDMTAEAKTEALRNYGREFAGWTMRYINGAERDVNVGDTIVPYIDFTLEARWNKVTVANIVPKDQTKVYDGTAALVNDGSKADDYELYIYIEDTWQQNSSYSVSGLSFAREESSKDIADVGTYTFTASGATVTGPNGALNAKYVFYDKGSLTITKRDVTIKAADTEVVYTSDKLYPSGVAALATTPLASGDSIDAESVEYDKYSVRVSNQDIAPKKVVIKNSAGKDVTANYNISFEAGSLKVTPMKITIAPADNTVSYDGKAHSITYKITSGSLGKNDSVVLTTNDVAHIDAGEYKNIKITGVAITNSLVNGDATSSYEITIDEKASATLTITAHYLRIRPVSKTTIYAGPSTSLTADSFEIVDGSLLDGHKIVEPLTYEGTINVVADGVGVTKYSNIDVSSIKIVDAEDNDVTALYKIETERGTLRIEPIDLVIIAGSNSASYSGNAITPDPKYTLVGNLLPNHKLVDVVVSGSQTYVGESVTKVTSYDIVDISNNISVLGNNYYRVTLNDGKLIITENPNKPQPETVTVEIKSASKVYDGKPLTLTKDNYIVTDTKGILASSGYSLVVTVDTTTSITDAGSKDIAAPTVAVYDSNKNQVTDLQSLPFIIDTKGGTLTVEKLTVTLTAASASKKYDGKALTAAKLASATVANASGQLPSGHNLNKNDIIYQGSQTNVGSSANKITSAIIKDANGNSMNHNYNIVFVDGVLTVTSAATTGTGTTAGGASTGDNSNLGLWIGIMIALAVAAAAVVFIVLKKKKAEQ